MIAQAIATTGTTYYENQEGFTYPKHDPSKRQLVLTNLPLRSSGKACKCGALTAFTCECGQPHCMACADKHAKCACDKPAKKGKRS